MKRLGVYCEMGAHDTCPRTRSCSCECHDDDLGDDDMKTGLTYRCDVTGCPFTTDHAPGLASHRRSAHGSNIKPVAPGGSGGTHTDRTPATTPAAALGSALDKAVTILSPNGDGGQLIWEQPPVRNGSSIVDRAGELIPALKRRAGEWARIVTYSGKTSAGGYTRKLRERYPDCEFRAGKHGTGSAIWARAIEVDA